jgi:3,4-dihydroxy-2-butanone 4-phosphate synthase
MAQFMSMQFNTIEEVLADIRAGKMVIITDDPGRENEGNLVMAAEMVTPEAINFMVTHGRGLICAPIAQARAEKLGLQRMVLENRESQKTAFTVSVDAADGISTGISAADRAATIRVLVAPKAGSQELVQPGHVFPLQARNGGVLQRRGVATGWAHGGSGGSGPFGGAATSGRDLRDIIERWIDGAPAGVDALQGETRAENRHAGGSDRLPA